MIWFLIYVLFGILLYLMYLNRAELLELTIAFLRNLPDHLQNMYSPYAPNGQPPGGFFSMRPMRHHYNDLLLAENQEFRTKIANLENTVVAQQNEIAVLKSMSADVLRRLQRLEAPSTSSNSHQQHQHHNPYASMRASTPEQRPRLSSRLNSQSAYALAQPPTTLRTNGHANQTLRSPEEVDDDLTPTSPRGPSTSLSRHNSDASSLVNVSVGLSARGSPMRKWVSSHDMQNQPRLGSYASPSLLNNSRPNSPAASLYGSNTALSRSTSRAGSTTSLAPTRRSMSGLNLAAKEPTYSALNHTLQLNIVGRNVTVPVPTQQTIDMNSVQEAPDTVPSIEWVYGYRGKDVRGNLLTLPTGEIVYFCGCIIVMYNTDDNVQRYYSEHTSDVKCITLHPNRVLIASGQTTRHHPDRGGAEHRNPVVSPEQLEKQLEREQTGAHVRIWDSVSMSTMIIIGGFEAKFDRGVVSLAFSQSDGGQLLSCIDDAFQRTMSVWNWKNRTRITHTKACNDQVFESAWHPSIPGLIVVCGKGHFSFFNLDFKAGVLQKMPVLFEGRDKPKTVLSMCFTEAGYVVTGDSNGTISMWDPHSLKVTKQAHNVHPGGVFSITLTKRGHLLSVGKDRVVSEYDAVDLVKRRKSIELPDDAGMPRAVVSTFGSKIIIGTSKNSVYTGSLDSAFTEIIQGDAEEITCCCLHPNGSSIAICSSDGWIQSIDTVDHRVEWTKMATDGITSCSFDTMGSSMVIGFVTGQWHVIDATTRETIVEHRESSSPITLTKFSPNGFYLVVATKEFAFLIYRVENGGRSFHLVTRIGGLSSWMTTVDWNEDSTIIRANSAAGHLYFWSLPSGENVDPLKIRDTKWHSTTCKASFEAGLATHGVQGVTCVAGSTTMGLLSLAKETGALRLYQNPVLSNKADFHSLHGHAHSVSSTTFTRNSTLLTVGATDCSIIQWKLSK